jgi:hypothetical protein
MPATPEEAVRTQKMVPLLRKGYRRVYADREGRIAVEVHEERYAEPELYRRVWGPEWPVVRSQRWRNPKFVPDEAQFTFHSREY